ncbi:class I SAM-dependent methyltransferase [Patescibacteria group bacterium]|nr:class I SAM-dependent methyltransferase [Patescibacteria group bacterium]MCG2702533.1 class I SAM-dependent methyltransferase [Candidatus Parcubacteria bacterium]MBU4265115.1 class I SAM-dependent methyltransferase [Patescibacteria group bacterium]MBU4390679.1 class I SAM-dependent methyltransferase [Patescibacteria group bacterium]MBU4396921.1 class I SAM-dependent methyltransferase [Patescibacteria group bacterium]
MTKTIDFKQITHVFRHATFDKKLTTIYSHAEEIIGYLKNFSLENQPSNFIKNYVQDAIARFLHTLSLIPYKDNGTLLEIGSNPYLLTILIKKIFNYKITSTNFFDHNIYLKKTKDITQSITNHKYNESYKFNSIGLNIEHIPYPFKTATFDTVLFCEVLEHLIINPLSVFSEFYRILKKGGQLIITTPNAARLTNIATILKGENIFDLYHPENGVYGRHNREFILQELKKLVTDNNFKIKYCKTHDRFDYNLINIYTVGYHGIKKTFYKKNDLISNLKLINANTQNLGDNIYLVCQKPSVNQQ